MFFFYLTFLSYLEFEDVYMIFADIDDIFVRQDLYEGKYAPDMTYFWQTPMQRAYTLLD